MAYILVKSFKYANIENPGLLRKCETQWGQEFFFHKAFPMANRTADPAANAADNASLTEFFETYSDAQLVARLDEMPAVKTVVDPDCSLDWAVEVNPRFAQA